MRPDEIEPGRRVPNDWDRTLVETWRQRKIRRALEATGSDRVFRLTPEARTVVLADKTTRTLGAQVRREARARRDVAILDAIAGGMTFLEAAQQQGVSRATVAGVVFRARKGAAP